MPLVGRRQTPRSVESVQAQCVELKRHWSWEVSSVAVCAKETASRDDARMTKFMLFGFSVERLGDIEVCMYCEW